MGRAEVLLQREVRRAVDAVVGNDVQILRLRWSGKGQSVTGFEGNYHLHHDRAHLVDLAHDLGALAEVADRVGNVGRLVHVKAVVDLQLRLGRPDLLAEPLVCGSKGNLLGIRRFREG